MEDRTGTNVNVKINAPNKGEPQGISERAEHLSFHLLEREDRDQGGDDNQQKRTPLSPGRSPYDG